MRGEREEREERGEREEVDKSVRRRPPHRWSRAWSQQEPSREVHTFSRPPMLEALSLLPVALRVGSYLIEERRSRREPIFDLNGLMLEPPNPGPHSGCPLGALGGGCIGRGYRGDFRRWSLHPGKYSHETVHCNQFSIRVKRQNGEVHSKVLSIFDRKQVDKSLRDWNWGVPADKVTYHAVFPRAWTEFREPVAGVNVEILQISPVIPNNYSDSSLPCCVFEVNVTNLLNESIECSVMFTFQNSDGTLVDSEPLDSEGFSHESFSINFESSETSSGDQKSEEDDNESAVPLAKSDTVACEGVCMARHHITRILHDEETSTVPLHNERLKESPKKQHMEMESPIAYQRKDSRSNSSDFCSDGSSFSCKAKSGNNSEEYVYSDTGSFAIAALASQSVDDNFIQEISTCERFLVHNKSKKSSATHCIGASTVWDYFLENGSLRKIHDGIESTVSDGLASSPSISTPPLLKHHSSYKHMDCGSAVCVQRTILPGTTPAHFKFSLAWDNPVVRFGAGRGYLRYHSRFFGSSGLSAPSIAAYALSQADNWNHEIEVWQHAIAENESLPEYYRHLLFNELYYLVDGGTVWIESEPYDSTDNQIKATERTYNVVEDTKWDRLLSQDTIAKKEFVGTSHQELTAALISQGELRINALGEMMRLNDDKVKNSEGKQAVVGKFLYLEGHEYLMYNTYDVHFYAGFALLMLWPQLELSLQRDFARSVALDDPTSRVMLGEGEKRPRKMPGAVPHDLGSPTEDPFHRTNIYNFQDVSRWKDLGPKFILQIYRDYKYTKSPWFLVDMFPVALQVMENTIQFDRDNDGMIENEGFPDQTYDIWIASGVHAYCGGLWIAACSAMSAMGRILDDAAVEEKYKGISERATEVYNSKLWNGEYFNYDSSTSGHHDSIMADMMAGHWYSILCDLPPIVPEDRALSCYRKIFSYNVELFGKGHMMGAVNGMRPNGTIDTCCLQSREVWTGTTYGLAAAMIHESKRGKDTCINKELFDMGVNTARGIHDAGWDRFGYFFATPEAWEQSGNYRSLGYMRPLAVWAMQYAIQHESEVEGNVN